MDDFLVKSLAMFTLFVKHLKISVYIQQNRHDEPQY